MPIKDLEKRKEADRQRAKRRREKARKLKEDKVVETEQAKKLKKERAVEVETEGTEGKIEAHPLADCWPLLGPGEFLDLRASIELSGVREPVVLYEGKILDGRHRYDAAWAENITCPTVAYDGDDPVQFVADRNAHRRHLTKTEIAVAVVKMSDWAAAGRPRKSKVADAPAPKKTNEGLAKIADVSSATVRRAKRQVREERGEVAPKPPEPDDEPDDEPEIEEAQGLTAAEKRVVEREDMLRQIDALEKEKYELLVKQEELAAQVQLAIDDETRPHLAGRINEITVVQGSLRSANARVLNQSTELAELRRENKLLRRRLNSMEKRSREADSAEAKA